MRAKRILWNEAERKNIDEFVIHDAATVHIEQMSDDCYWIGIYGQGDGAPRMSFNVVGKKLRLLEQDTEFTWEEDATHEHWKPGGETIRKPPSHSASDGPEASSTRKDDETVPSGAAFSASSGPSEGQGTDWYGPAHLDIAAGLQVRCACGHKRGSHAMRTIERCLQCSCESFEAGDGPGTDTAEAVVDAARALVFRDVESSDREKLQTDVRRALSAYDAAVPDASPAAPGDPRHQALNAPSEPVIERRTDSGEGSPGAAGDDVSDDTHASPERIAHEQLKAAITNAIHFGYESEFGPDDPDDPSLSRRTVLRGIEEGVWLALRTYGLPPTDSESPDRVCVVMYPTDRKGTVSYIFGVFDSVESARDTYYNDGEDREENPPEFIEVPLYRPSDSQVDSDARACSHGNVRLFCPKCP